MEHDQLAMDIAWLLHTSRLAGNENTVQSLLRVRYNLVFLGSGNFSSVMQHPYRTDRVIKIMSPDRLNRDGSNPLLDDPYLGYITWCREQTDPIFPKVFDIIMYDRCAVIVLEKLNTMSLDDYHAAYKQYFSRAIEPPKIIQYMKDVLGDWDDVHENNVMRRANGDIVLTDPYAYRGPTDRRYEDYVRVNGRITMQVKHGTMARNSKSFADWCKDKDQVLRGRQDHDGVEVRHWVPGALLPGQFPRRLRTIRGPEPTGDRGAKGFAHFHGRAADVIIADTLADRQPRTGQVERVADFVKDVALACIDRPINKLHLRNFLQPELRAGDRPDIQVRKHRDPAIEFSMLADPRVKQQFDIDHARRLGWFRVEDNQPVNPSKVFRKDVA